MSYFPETIKTGTSIVERVDCESVLSFIDCSPCFIPYYKKLERIEKSSKTINKKEKRRTKIQIKYKSRIRYLNRTACYRISNKCNFTRFHFLSVFESKSHL